MRTISMVFHPLLVPTHMMLLFWLILPILFAPVPAQAIPMLILATFLTTCVIPVLSIGFLKMTSKVTTYDLTVREERIFPFISIAMFYSAACWMFLFKLEISKPLSIIIISITALVFILLLITLKFKISIHSAAVWGCGGIICALGIKLAEPRFLIPLAGLFPIAGLVSSSRLYLKFHNPSEIWIGSGVGFTICFLTVLLFG